MIELTCEACSQKYPLARGHQCPKGADKAPVPWKDREAAYRKAYAAQYMRAKRAREKKRYATKAEELRTVAETFQNADRRLRMQRLADSYDLLAECHNPDVALTKGA